MKECILTDWRQLHIRTSPRPIPQEGQALIRVHYAGVCGSDVSVYMHHHLTATIPRVLCHEILGFVESVNSLDPTPIEIGDRVVVFPLRFCGSCNACREGYFHVCKDLQIMGLHIDGGFAEFITADLDALFKVPEELPDLVAALIEPFAVGVHANMRANTRPGEDVFIVGAGPIGITTGICAKWFGASNVIISEIDQGRRALARAFGMTVVDPSTSDLHKVVNTITNGDGCDVVFEASGTEEGSLILTDVCKIRGRAVLLGVPSKPVPIQGNKAVLKEIYLIGSRVYTLADFGIAIRLLHCSWKKGEYAFEELVDGIYPLEKTEEAILKHHRGDAAGKLIVRMERGQQYDNR